MYLHDVISNEIHVQKRNVEISWHDESKLYTQRVALN